MNHRDPPGQPVDTHVQKAAECQPEREPRQCDRRIHLIPCLTVVCNDFASIIRCLPSWNGGYQRRCTQGMSGRGYWGGLRFSPARTQPGPSQSKERARRSSRVLISTSSPRTISLAATRCTSSSWQRAAELRFHGHDSCPRTGCPKPAFPACHELPGCLHPGSWN